MAIEPLLGHGTDDRRLGKSRLVIEFAMQHILRFGMYDRQLRRDRNRCDSEYDVSSIDRGSVTISKL